MGSLRAWDIVRLGGRAVVLIRDPHDAIISNFNHERSQTWDQTADLSGMKVVVI